MPDYSNQKSELQPLKVSCGDTDCPNDLHCYRQNRRLPKRDQLPNGVCWSCGEDGVDWDRIHRRDVRDFDFLTRMLRTELVRYAYWEADIKSDTKAYNHARRKGKAGLREAISHKIRKYLAEKSSYDGRNTSKTGNAVCYAQHATACCCRRCMSYWHGIPESSILTEDQVEYFTKLCMRYIDEKLPGLSESGERIPRRHRRLKAQPRLRQNDGQIKLFEH